MIGILLNDTAYEQDIRELLMAFYPGETVFPIDYDVRLNAKTTIKKELYGMLKKRTGKNSPGGP